MLMKITECIGAILLIISVFKVVDSYKWWILYSVATILYIVNMIYLGTIPYAIMGGVLLVTGIRNYLKGKKNAIR